MANSTSAPRKRAFQRDARIPALNRETRLAATLLASHRHDIVRLSPRFEGYASKRLDRSLISGLPLCKDLSASDLDRVLKKARSLRVACGDTYRTVGTRLTWGEQGLVRSGGQKVTAVEPRGLLQLVGGGERQDRAGN